LRDVLRYYAQEVGRVSCGASRWREDCTIEVEQALRNFCRLALLLLTSISGVVGICLLEEILHLIRITETDLIELAAARRPELEVGTVPHEVRKYLGCSRDTVFLSSESLKHIIQKHGDHITHADIQLIPIILFSGVWLSDDRNTHAVATFLFEGRRYKLVLKVTVDRRRTYVKTLHRTSPRQTKSLLSKAKRIRDGWYE